MQSETAALLDDRSAVERLDPHGLLGRIEGLPEQCAEAWEAAAGLELPVRYTQARAAVLLGMGGSAIAGDMLRALASPAGRVPVVVVRGYDLPAFVDGETLVIACSHSGETEETLSGVEQALAVGAPVAAVTMGGRLAALAKEHDLPLLRYEYAGEPRSALGHQLMALLALGERAGLLEPQAAAVAETVAVLRELRDRLGFGQPAAQNAAKQLAARLHGRLPAIVGAEVLAPAAYRWKTQLNENAKCWALCEELPELHHNSIAGFGLPAEVVERLHMVLLRHAALHPRLLLRYELTAAALAEAGVSHETVDAVGESPLARVLSAVFTGDLVSYYLALLNGVEPSPVAALLRVKARLAEL